MNERISLLVICGPTASGKTRLAVDLAKALGGEVIGADSMQIYKGMSIATAKPSDEEKSGIPHHLIDFLEPDEDFSVAQYVGLAHRAISVVHAGGKLPILAGGTGLYISSVADNISFEDIPRDEALRERLLSEAKEYGGQYMIEKLRESDPELAGTMHPNNLGRIVRALEVFALTGKTMTEHRRKSRENPQRYKLCMIGIGFSDREALYGRINARVDLMMEQGLLEEAKQYVKLSGTASQAIGYKELRGYFEGRESLCESVENIKRETRRYAKRQMTWFSRDGRIRWFFADKYASYADLLDDALSTARITLKMEEDSD